MARMVMMFLCVVVSWMVLTAPYAEAAISCGQMVSKLVPCTTYLAKGGSVSSACCDGVKGINGAAKGTPDRQAACNCLKSAAKSTSGLNPSNAASLPGKCGVNLPYKISPNMNCNTVT